MLRQNKNVTRYTIFHILHIGVGDRGVAASIYQKLQDWCTIVFVRNLTMACLYVEALKTLK